MKRHFVCGEKAGEVPNNKQPWNFFLPGNRFLDPTDMEAIKNHLAIIFNIIEASGDQGLSL